MEPLVQSHKPGRFGPRRPAPPPSDDPGPLGSDGQRGWGWTTRRVQVSLPVRPHSSQNRHRSLRASEPAGEAEAPPPWKDALQEQTVPVLTSSLSGVVPAETRSRSYRNKVFNLLTKPRSRPEPQNHRTTGWTRWDQINSWNTKTRDQRRRRSHNLPPFTHTSSGDCRCQLLQSA